MSAGGAYRAPGPNVANHRYLRTVIVSYQHLFGNRQRSGHQRRVRQGAGDTQGDVKAVSDQIDKLIIAMQLKLDIRVASLKTRQPLRQVQRPHHQRNTDPQQTFRTLMPLGDSLGGGLTITVLR